MYQYNIEAVFVNVESISNEFFQVVDLFMTLDREIKQNTPLTWVKRDPEELLLDQLYLRDWKRDVHIRLKSDRHAIAIRAPYCRFIKSVHQVNNN